MAYRAVRLFSSIEPRTLGLYNLTVWNSTLPSRNLARQVSRPLLWNCSFNNLNGRGLRLWKSLDTTRSNETLLLSKHLYSKGNVLTRTSISRDFHTSSRRLIPPLLLLVIKPVGKLASIITGRTLRKWWARLTPEEKAKYRTKFGEKRHVFAAILGLFGVFSIIHYFTHIQETPITHRRRYISLTDEQAAKIAQFEYDVQFATIKDRLLPMNHPAYKYIAKVGQRIVDANQDIEYMRDKVWTIHVIESEEQNAFVLPTGHIFVFTGLLQIANTEQKLAVILGHEMSHALLSHGIEQLSFSTVIDAVVIIVMAALWTVMPTDGIALITQWFYDKCMQVMLHLPYSRKLEREADEVGLHLIAKACYDVRESPVFWSSWSLHAQAANGGERPIQVPQWLSTHPTNDQRAIDLNKLIPDAIRLRESCKCSALPAKDPRESLQYLQQLIQEKQEQKQQQQQQQQQLKPSAA